MGKEMLYEKGNMNSALSLIASADSKLKVAKNDYNSSKLTGTTFISDAETIIEEAEKAFGDAASALAGIDTSVETEGFNFNPIDLGLGPMSEEAFMEYMGIEVEDVQPIEGESDVTAISSDLDSFDMLDLTMEDVEAYEAEVQRNLELCDELIDIANETIDTDEAIIKNFLWNYADSDLMFEYELQSLNGIILTPEEYLNYLLESIGECLDSNGQPSEEIYQAKVAEAERLAEAYRIRFENAFKKATNRSYSEVTTELNSAKEVLNQAMSGKYPLQQQQKLVPYLEIMTTDEYKNYIKQNPDLSVLRDYYPELYYYDSQKDEMVCYVSEQDQMMLLYLIDNAYEPGLPASIDYEKAIEDKINQAKGKRDFEETLKMCVDENGKIDLNLLSACDIPIEGLKDGVVTWWDGICNTFRTDGMMTATQYKQMYLMQELSNADNVDAEVLKFLYQNGSTIGNMAVPMLVSTLLGPAGGGLVGAKTAAKVGSVLMGWSAGVNAKNQALISGYATPNAYFYGIVSGLSETATGYLLGKIPHLSATSGLTFGNLLSEGFEEFTQEWYDAGMRAIFLGEHVDWNSIPADAMNSFMMGVLVAGELNGMQAISIMTSSGVAEIAFAEIQALCEQNPDMSVMDAATMIIMEARAANIDGYKISNGVDQNVLNAMFSPKEYNLSYTVKQDLLNICLNYSDAIESFMIQKGYEVDVAKASVQNFIERLSNPDSHSISFQAGSMILNACLAMNIEPEKVNSIKNNMTTIGHGEDINAVKEAIYKRAERKGISRADVDKAFTTYNSSGERYM